MVKTDREIYEEVRNDLLRFAAVLVGPDDAADVVSSVITRTLARRGSLTTLDAPRPYLMTGVANEARSLGRRWSRTVRGVPDVASVVEPDVAAGRYPDVTAAVMELPARQRAAMFLVYWLGMSGAEAARVMECQPATVRRYLSLARDKLGAQFDA